jgi:hypothetical protein
MQVEVLEVEATLSDRLRTYWKGSREDTDTGGASTLGGPDSVTRGAVIKGTARIPLEKLLVTPNKPRQAIWQLHAEGTAEGGRGMLSVGHTALETVWLPACTRPREQ